MGTVYCSKRSDSERDKCGCVAWLWCITMFPALCKLWVIFSAINNMRSAPDSTEVVQVSHWSNNMCTTNHHLCTRQWRKHSGNKAKLWQNHAASVGWYKLCRVLNSIYCWWSLYSLRNSKINLLYKKHQICAGYTKSKTFSSTLV